MQDKDKFESMLKGGHPNSLGKTLQVVDIVINNKDKLAALFDCYLSSDATVRLRVSSACKRIFRQHRSWFVEYVDKFQHLIPKLQQPSAEWTLAQLHLECEDLLTENQKRKAIEICKAQLENSGDWIVLIRSMEFLQHIAKNDELTKQWLMSKLVIIIQDKRKSVSKKARMILQSFA